MTIDDLTNEEKLLIHILAHYMLGVQCNIGDMFRRLERVQAAWRVEQTLVEAEYAAAGKPCEWGKPGEPLL